MNFDQLGQDLSQQPLLSSQIIPEMADNELVVDKSVKSQTVITQPIVTSQSNVQYKIVQPNSTTVQIKANAVNQNITPQKQLHIVKKVPANVVQVVDSKSNMKQNTITNDIVANNPIVINKVNGNISGKFEIPMITLNKTRFQIEYDIFAYCESQF